MASPQVRLEALKLAVMTDGGGVEQIAPRYERFLETGSFEEQKAVDLNQKSVNTPDQPNDVVDLDEKPSPTVRRRKK